MKKFTGMLTLIALFAFVGFYSGRENLASAISSAMRLSVIGPDEDAIYVVSTSENVPAPETKAFSASEDLSGLEMNTVSGNTVSGNAAGGLTMEAEAVFVQVNQARADIGLPELVWSEELAAAAEVRAQEIHQSFSHTRPDGSPWWTANSEVIYGENIAKGYQTADSVVTAWMESADHKDNILYSGFQTIGVAVYNVDGKWYWAQEFGY